MNYPKGYKAFGVNVGIKDQSLDFGIVYSEVVADATALFTKNQYPGAPLIVGKKHVSNGKLQAIVVNSKNSNVATGVNGIKNTELICEEVARALDINKEDILPSSTGVIGVPLPIEKIIPYCKKSKSLLKENNLEEFAKAIMTTDKTMKIAKREIETDLGKGMIFGIAKGAGMIEPNMATMLCYIFTDVKLNNVNLYEILFQAAERSFHCLSIDSDTSTSDTLVLMNNGLSGVVKLEDFQKSLNEVCVELTKMIAVDGEGATKLIEVEILNAKSKEQAKKFGKAIINSPLIKTAVYGGDPNWGRIVMAMGKVFDEQIPLEKIQVKIGYNSIHSEVKSEVLSQIAKYLKENSTIEILIDLNSGVENLKFYGCDLSEEYININAKYTT